MSVIGAEARVQRIVPPLADHVDGEHGGEDRDAGFVQSHHAERRKGAVQEPWPGLPVGLITGWAVEEVTQEDPQHASFRVQKPLKPAGYARQAFGRAGLRGV